MLSRCMDRLWPFTDRDFPALGRKNGENPVFVLRHLPVRRHEGEPSSLVTDLCFHAFPRFLRARIS